MKDVKTIDLNSLPIESVTVQLRELFDDCEQTLRVVESIQPDDWRRVQNFGKMLARARQLTPHGEWADYITDTFAGRLTMRVAQRIVAAELNPDAEEKRKEKDRKRAAEKRNATDAKNPSHLKTAGVVVTTPDNSGQLPVTPDNSDPDPAPNPPTITPEILPEEPAADPVWDWLLAATIDDIVTAIIERTENRFEQKKTARALRKWADKLDPPKQASIPTVERMSAEIPEDWPDSLRDAAGMWARFRQGLPKAKRIQNLEAWIAALEHMGEQPAEVVVRKIRTAVESSWQGWDVEKANGSNGNGHTNRGIAKPAKPTGASVFG